MHDSAARAPRGGRERRVGLRKPVVVRRDRRTAYRHSGGLLDSPIGFPKAHPSLPPGERAVSVELRHYRSAVSVESGWVTGLNYPSVPGASSQNPEIDAESRGDQDAL